MNFKYLLVPILALSAYSLVNLSPVTSQKTIPTSTKQTKYDKPDKAAQWLATMRQTKDKSKSPAQLNRQIKSTIDTIEFTRKLNKAASIPDIPKFAYENLGPSNFGGRIRAFTIKSDDSNQLLSGGVLGGIFKSTNAGLSWELKNDFLPSLAIGSMIIDPDNPNRVFLGTGEGFFNFDASRGAGIFVSEDFGDTWSQLPATDNDNFYFVNRLTRIPNSDTLLAATREGIFRSLDLGQSWTEVSQFSVIGRGFVDLKSDPSNSNHLLAVHYGNPNDALAVNITTPASIVGSYDAVLASFGPDFPTIGTGNKSIELVNDGSGTTNDACEAISTNLSGKIALAQRGSCNFTVKVKNAQNAGAVAVIIYQNLNDDAFSMGGEDETITIPSAMISKADGDLIASATGVNGSINNVIKTTLDRFVMESNDSGASWHQLNESNGLPVSNVGRMELAFGTDGVTYVMVANNDDETLGLWKSNGSGANFAKTTSNTQFIERQGWYDLAIAVDPNNSDKVFLGAIDQYVSNNGGSTLVKNTQWDPIGSNNDIAKYMHSDHHGYFFDPNNSTVIYTVGDGGIYKSTNSGVNFQAINSGLSISQSYGIALHPSNGRVTSGTQDNGSQIYFGDINTWIEWRGGDGGYSAWDQQNSNYLYGSNPEGVMFGSNNSGNSISIMELPDTDGALFIQPFALDPNNGNRLVVGTDNVFFTSNARLLGNAQFTDISGTLASGSVSALTFNQLVTSQLLVGMTGGNLYKIQNIGTQNNVIDITPNNGLSDYITDIKVDESDSSGNTIYITQSLYDSNRILKTTNGGTNWTSISGNLPDMPLYQVSIDPIDSNRIFVGSEIGLWVTNLSSATPQWTRYHYGVAYTRVVDLVWSDNDTLYIGTHGRGTYKATRNALAININKVVTTNSSNDDDGILDAGETGLIMFEIQNNSGFDINNADLTINIDQSATQNIALIPAQSSVIISQELTLDSTSECLNELNIATALNYDNIDYSKSHQLITAANKNINSNEFSEGAESNEHSMSITTQLGNSAWRRVSNSAHTGSSSWFTSDEASYSDKSLISPWLIMNAGGNTLSFALKYDTESDANQHWDGAVLEIREKDGLWQDIGHLSSVAYDGQLFTNNTASTRRAWSGNHNSWRNASVNLSENYKGKTIQFRFRMVSDTESGGTGFWVDDIHMSNVIWSDKKTCDENINQGHKLPLPGFWYDRSRNGHGFVIEPIGYDNLYFTVFYTYDDAGNPEWYTSLSTLENGVLNINFEADTLQRFLYDYSIDPAVNQANILDSSITDGRLSIDFNSDSISTSNACQDGITGRPEDLIGLAKWKINNQQGQWCIEPIIAETNKGFPDVAGNWYGGVSDSGWGISFALANKLLVATIYYYDDTGRPRWAIGQQDNFEQGQEITIAMREVSGFGRLDTAIETTSVPAGTITATISNLLGNVSIDGTSTIDIEYKGIEGGQWIRNNVPITILTKPHD
jgi:hypothetical protein